MGRKLLKNSRKAAIALIMGFALTLFSEAPEDRVLNLLEKARIQRLIDLPPHFVELKKEATRQELLPWLKIFFKKIQESPESCVAFDPTLLEELVREYPELWEVGDQKPWNVLPEPLQAVPSRRLSPQDSVFKDLAVLAEKGYIESYPGAAFTHRVFTRDEVVRILDRLLDRLRRDDIKLPHEDHLVLLRVLEKFEMDLTASQIRQDYPTPLDPDQPPSQGWRDWVFSGSSTMTHNKIHGDGNDTFTHRFDLELDHPWVTLTTSGTFDDQSLEDPTIDFHSGYRYKWEEGLIDFHVPYWKNYELSLQGGNLTSLGFAEGLVASGVNVVGGRFYYQAPESRWSLDLANGFVEDERDRVSLAGITYAPHDFWDLTVYGADRKADSDKRHNFDFALANTLRHPYGSLFAEYGNLESLGEGFFGRKEFSFFEQRLTLTGEIRIYRRFETIFGNPPSYSGISGAETINQREHFASFAFQPFSWLEYAFEFDHSESYHREERLDNYSHELILTLWEGGEISGSYEEEDGTPVKRISEGGISQTFDWGLTVGFDFSREDDGTGNTETSQFDADFDFGKVWSRLEGWSVDASGTRTKTLVTREEDYQMGVEWDINDQHELSARFTKTDTDNDSWDFVWSARF